MSARVSYAERDGVASIWLDDGKVNVMSIAMLADIATALDAPRKAPSSCCCVRGVPVFSVPDSI